MRIIKMYLQSDKDENIKIAEEKRSLRLLFVMDMCGIYLQITPKNNSKIISFCP